MNRSSRYLLCIFLLFCGSVSYLAGQSDTSQAGNLKTLLPPTQFQIDSLKKPDFDLSNSGTDIKSKLKPGSFIQKTTSRLKKFSSSGTIGIGYEYGLLPFVTNSNDPTGYFRAEGNMDIKLLAVPFQASFYYSDKKNITGLNNFFRVVYDANKLKEELKENVAAQQGQVHKELNSIYAQKQFLQQKLLYAKYMQQYSDLHPPNFNKPNIPNLGQNPLNGVQLPGKDSLQGNLPDTSLVTSNLNQYTDSIEHWNNYKEKTDSLRTVISKYEGQIAEYENKIKELNNTLEQLKDPKKLVQNAKSRLTKTQNFFTNVKKLEVGMCYPNYSTFLVNGIALKGINIEYNKKDFYLAFTHGKTVNNLLFTNNAVQNQLFNMQNLYNFFDFNYVRDSRRITAAKFGYGKKEDNHLYFGLLYGMGLPSYVNNSTIINPENTAIPDRNFVAEIDGKYVFSEKCSLDLVYGRSALQTAGQYFNSEDNGFNAMLHSGRSNAAMGKYTLQLAKTRTKLTALGRWVDPFFKSYGIGFMRSDNFRCELRAEQQLGKKIKFTGLYRRDEDNLLSIYNYKTVLQTIGATLTVRIKRSLTIKAGYNPVIHQIDTKDQTYKARNLNSISNFMLTYMPALKKGSTLFNFMYNYYYLTTGEQNTIFNNITFSNITQFKKAFKNSVTAGWFCTNAVDSVNNDTWLFTDELTYTFKNGGTIGCGIKGSYNSSRNWEYGGLLKAGVPLMKNVGIELCAEKLVYGDFYNSLNLASTNRFPYYCYAKLIVNW